MVDEQARSEFVLDLDRLVLQGARRMLAAALEAEVAVYIEAYVQERVSGKFLARPLLVSSVANA